MKVKPFLIAGALTVLLGTAACSPPVQTTGYEGQQGYQEPDHGYLYYWLAYNASMGMYQPRVTYHVYVPPAGYPSYYRPWYPNRNYSPSVPPRVYTAPPARIDTRTTDGFQNAPRTAPVASGSTTKTGGGFSPAPTQNASPRQSGGFSAPATSRPAYAPPPSRTSGGFSSNRRR